MTPLWILALGCGPSAPAPAPPPPAVKAARPADAPPNIVVLLADDAGHADFGMTGSTVMKTPAIDRLAAEGVVFTNAYVTAPVCSPSRAGLLTGRYQQRFGHEGNPPLNGGADAGLPPAEQTLGDHLKAAGYTTGVFGKWHLGYAPHHHPNRRGFDVFEGVLRGERTYFPQPDDGEETAADWRRDGEVVAEDFDYVTDRIAGATVDFMVENRDRPFLAYVAFTAVHFPMESRPDDLAAQDPALTGVRRQLGGMTAGLDRAVGQITAAIDAMGLGDDTLVFFLNDNGAGKRNQGDNSPWRAGKGRVFDGGTHVPYVLRWPGRLAPGRTDALVSSLDIVPTALAAAGRPLPTERPLDGRDLAPVVAGGPGADALFWRLGRSWAVRVGPHKLVSDKGADPALYDLVADPGETRDLGDRLPAVEARLQARYDAWAAEMIAPAFESATERKRRKKKEKDAQADPAGPPPATP